VPKVPYHTAPSRRAVKVSSRSKVRCKSTSSVSSAAVMGRPACCGSATALFLRGQIAEQQRLADTATQQVAQVHTLVLTMDLAVRIFDAGE
jgi:hypothetical protein